MNTNAPTFRKQSMYICYIQIEESTQELENDVRSKVMEASSGAFAKRLMLKNKVILCQPHAFAIDLLDALKVGRLLLLPRAAADAGVVAHCAAPPPPPTFLSPPTAYPHFKPPPDNGVVAKNNNNQKNKDKKQQIYMPCEVTQAGIESRPSAHSRFVGDRTTTGPRLPSQTPGS